MDEAKILKECEETINKNGFVYYDEILSSLSENDKLAILYKIQSSGKYMLDLTPNKDWIIRDNPDHKGKLWTEKHPFVYAIVLAIISGIISWSVGKLQQQSENQEYNQLKQSVQSLNDSVAKIQLHIMDSAKHN